MTRPLLWLVLIVTVAGACAPVPSAPSPSPSQPPSGSGGVTTVRAVSPLVRSDAARATADIEAATRGAKALQAFDADLYALLAKQSGNIVFSPYSVAVALAMTRAGAAGATRDEMDRVLHAATAGDLDVAYNALDRTLAKRPGTYPWGGVSVPLELGTANQLWSQRDTEIAKAYLDRLASHYGAGVGVVDYIGAREAARRAINDWVSERTKTRITELIPEGLLNELTRFVLVNAIYFKGKWTSPFFATATAPAPFRRVDGTAVQARLMRGPTAPRLYAKGAAYQSVALPYAGGLSMVLVVPDAGSFATVEASLRDAGRLAAAIDLTERRNVNLAMPRFQFRTSSMLKGPLSDLGMPLAFTEDADFSGIAPRERLHLQAVVHQAFIAVDEEGTEAAAATAVIGGATGAPTEVVELTVDRPFLFAIRDDETGAVLFMGRVLDPTR